MRSLSWACVAIYMLFAMQAQAGEKPPDLADAINLFSIEGESASANITKASCNVTLTLDKDKFLQSIPMLQTAGILNPDMTTTQINRAPNSIAWVFATLGAGNATMQLYKLDRSVDQCSFIQYMNDIDDFGHTNKVKMFSYNFSRALSNKINWESFKAEKLPKIASQFKFGSEFRDTISDEW